jgi:outer membrane protein TolC
VRHRALALAGQAMVLASACVGCSSARLETSVPSPAPRPGELLHSAVEAHAAGEVVIDDRDGLSPDEAAVMAVDNNPRLRAVRAERGIVGAELIAAGLLPNPRLDASLDAPIAGREARTLGFGVGVSWNVSPLFSRGPRTRAAEGAARSVDLEVGWQEWQVAQAARLHTIRVVYLTRRLEAAREIEAAWERRTGALRAALERNAVTLLEATGAQHSLDEARLPGFDLEQDIARALVDLNEAIGLEPQAKVEVDASWRAPREVPSAQLLLDQLPTHRLDLIALDHAERSHDQALVAEVSAQFPALEIGVHAGRDVDDVSAGGLTLAFDLPFFDRNQGNVARARAQRLQTVAEYAARLAEARAQVVRLAREFELVARKLGVAAEAVRSSADLATLASQAAIGGGITPLAAADIEERASAARLRHLEIEQSLAELWLALVTASGTQ